MLNTSTIYSCFLPWWGLTHSKEHEKQVLNSAFLAKFYISYIVEGKVKTLEGLSKGVYSHKQEKYLLSYKILSGPQLIEDLNASSGN